jgi:c-di-GMP-binding flagellar brake protein YcgR
MNQERRSSKRIEKHIMVHFTVAGDDPPKWDVATVDNISAGGLKFKVSNDLQMDGKVIELRIKLPELLPSFLDLKAEVIEVQSNPKNSICGVRVKFIDLTEEDKKNIATLKEIIDGYGSGRKRPMAS